MKEYFVVEWNSFASSFCASGSIHIDGAVQGRYDSSQVRDRWRKDNLPIM
jgi:hypothetical protein